MPPLELLLDLTLRLILPAAAAGGLVLAAAVRCLPRRRWEIAVPAALLAGLAAGNVWRGSLPWVPSLPGDFGWPSLLAAAAAALTLSVLAACIRRALVRRLVLALGLVPIAALLVPGELHTAPWLLGLGTLVIANTLVLQGAVQGRARWAAPAAWAGVLAGGAAVVLLQSHSARLADAAILLAAALAGMAPFACRWPIRLAAAAPAVGLWLPGLMLSGHYDTFSAVPAASFALVAAAPLSLVLLWIPGVSSLPRWAQFGLHFLLPLIPVTIAIVLAIQAEGWALGM